MIRNYGELKAIALKELPELNACTDCGDWLHFYSDGDVKGYDIAVSKTTGETSSFVELITFGLIGPGIARLNFDTGEELET